MDGPENALVAAVIARLKADPAVSALVGARVWDQPAEDADFPQLLVGRSESRPVDADGGGAEQLVPLGGVPRLEGAAGARALAGAVRGCLLDAPLDPAGLGLVSLRVVYVDVFRGADHRRRYAVI